MNQGNNTDTNSGHTQGRRSVDDHSVRIALLEQGMESIKTQLQGINGNMNKLVWLVFSALILAVLKMMVTGVLPA